MLWGKRIPCSDNYNKRKEPASAENRVVITLRVMKLPHAEREDYTGSGNSCRSPKGSNRVIQGGSWNNGQNCRSANRNNNGPTNRNNNLGLRVALAPCAGEAGPDGTDRFPVPAVGLDKRS
jgi:formylglycine-generating enzyme required for sulfatase activity